MGYDPSLDRKGDTGRPVYGVTRVSPGARSEEVNGRKVKGDLYLV